MKFEKAVKRYKELVVVMAMGVAVAGVYAGVFANKLVADDWQFIGNWQAVESWQNLPRMIMGEVPPGHEGVFRPVRGVVYLVMYQLWGREVVFYHGFSVGVLLVSMFLLYLIVKKLSGKWEVAAVAVGLFGISPVQTEAITWMSSSFDSAASMGVLLSFYLWIRSEKPEQKLAAVVMGLVAMLWHEVAVSLPGLVFIYEWIWKKRSIKEAVRRTGWWWAMVMGYLYWRLYAMERGRGELLVGSGVANSLLVVYVGFEYVKLMAWPVKPGYVHELIWGVNNLSFASLSQVELAVGYWREVGLWLAVAGLGVVGGVVVKLKDKQKQVSFGLAWMVAALVPVVNLVPGAMVFAEKYAFLASAGWSMAVAGVVGWGWQRSDRWGRWVMAAGVVVVLGIYAGVVVERNQEWKDEVSLWQAETKDHPRVGRAWMELGLAYQGQGRQAEALAAYEQVMEVSPEVDSGYLAAAEINQALGNYEGAIENYEGLVGVAPHDASARLFLVYLRQVWAQQLVDQGKVGLAVEQLKMVVKEDPSQGQIIEEIKKLCGRVPEECGE